MIASINDKTENKIVFSLCFCLFEVFFFFSFDWYFSTFVYFTISHFHNSRLFLPHFSFRLVYNIIAINYTRFFALLIHSHCLFDRNFYVSENCWNCTSTANGFLNRSLFFVLFITSGSSDRYVHHFNFGFFHVYFMFTARIS